MKMALVAVWLRGYWLVASGVCELHFWLPRIVLPGAGLATKNGMMSDSCAGHARVPPVCLAHLIVVVVVIIIIVRPGK